MKFSASVALAALAAQRVAGHATFQALWVEGTDKAGTCLRTPLSNSPIESVTSTDLRCNKNIGAVAGKCTVAAGSTVTVEMHQQPNDRTCAQEGIGGQHYGPVIAYLSKVGDSSTADGSSGWFKIFQNGWSKVAGSTRGDDDNWGVKDLNKCCGRTNLKIPADIAPGDYLLRAEVIALHAAGPSGGAQFYISCFQLTITGGGSANPATVLFPGAYSTADTGIFGSIHGVLSSYVVPGPPVYSGGSTKVAGASACVGVETGTAPGPTQATTTTRAVTSTTLVSTTRTTSVSTSRTTAGGVSTTRTTTGGVVTTTSSGSTGGSPLYGQCGGQGWTGPTTCAQGRCVANGQWYSQCVP